MSILLITNDYPPIISGISTVFYQVWRYLPTETNIVLAPGVQGGKEFDSKDDIRVIRYPYISSTAIPAKLINFILQFLSTTYLVIRYRVRLLHAGQILTGGLIGLFFKKVFKIPYMLWVYGGETTPVYMKNKWRKRFLGRLIKEAELIITNSPTTSQEFLDYGVDKSRVFEVLPGVDTDVFTPGAPPDELVKKYGLTDKSLLMTVARLTPRKGQDTTIRALPSIIESHPDVVYLVVGDGPYRDELISLAKEMGVMESVIFSGPITDEELVGYYRLSDIYVMPNREVEGSTDSIEGFGISFIEAGACEKPVIGGRSGGAVFAVEDNITGIIVDPTDTDELSKAVVGLLSDNERARVMGIRGRERAIKFHWRYRAIQMEELHEKYQS